MGGVLCKPGTYKMKRSFPTFAVLVLVAGIIWLLTELGYLTIDIPWLPIVVVIFALGWIINHYAHGS